MNDLPVNADRLLQLAGAVFTKSASESDRVELNDILLADETSRRQYLDYCRMHVALRVELHAGRAVQTACRQINTDAVGAASGNSDIVQPVVPVAPAFPNLFHSTFSSGWPIAYLIATVLCTIGLTIAAIVHVSQPSQERQLVAPSPNPQSPIPNPSSIVAHVTGMVDCEWEEAGFGVQGSGAANHKSEILNQKSPIRLGDRLALRSGLLELTYETGAKVILQGPVTYEVESVAGGYLALGKLTAKLEKRSEVRGQRSETSNPQSPIPNPSSSPQSLAPSLFVITTPTALVTDLGTEFGVEVDRSGQTTSHVFRGSVRLQAINAAGAPSGVGRVLHETESACVDLGDVRRIAAPDTSAASTRFLRDLPRRTIKNTNSLPMQVLAWFRMGEDDPNAVARKPVEEQLRDHRGYVLLNKCGSPKYSDDTAAPGSSLAMSFNGGADAECLGSARFPYVVTDYFILEAWVKMRKTSDFVQTIVHNGQTDLNGYALVAINGTWQCVFERVAMCDSGVACELGKWTHLALVCERGKSQLWVNGRAVGKAIDAIPKVPDGPFGIGALYERGQCRFYGEIDEVRLSTFVAPFQPTMLLLRKDMQPQ